MNQSWLALIIGNSRLHWAWFVGDTLQQSWDTNHLSTETVHQLTAHRVSTILPQKTLPPLFVECDLQAANPIPLYLASVVPEQTSLWHTYPDVTIITLEQIPLLGLYPTLGIDRALAVWGAGARLGYPVLVIDAGTALTFTGADTQHQLVGGAILPGLRLQLQSLGKNTAALPAIPLPTQLPPRWARQTPTAIESGVIYTVLAGIRDFVEDWRSHFPHSQIVFTGGDAQVLLTYLQSQYPEIADQFRADPHLIFWGIQSIYKGVGG